MTHVNFVVDCSGSMGATASSIKYNGKTLNIARWEVMRYNVSIMLDSMVDGGDGTDTFSIIEFETNANFIVNNMKVPAKRLQNFANLPSPEEWKANQPFERVMHDLSEYMLDKAPQGLSHPIFLPRGGTNIAEALKVTASQTPANTPTLTLLFTDMWDDDGSYIYNALMTSCGPRLATTYSTVDGPSCLDALTLNGPLIVVVICDRSSLNRSETGCKALEKKVNQHFGKDATGKSFACIAETLDAKDGIDFYGGFKDLL